MRGYFRRTTPIGRAFLTELLEKHDVCDAVFRIDDAADLAGALRKEGLDYRVEIHGYGDRVERVFQETQRRTSSFSDCFSNVDPSTAEPWLQAHAVWLDYA
ncbi:hypothetical protein JCM17823_04810 [Halorubrum gandharaense]